MEKQCLEWRKNVTYVGRKAGVLLENTVCPYYQIDNGAKIEFVQKLLGHSEMDTTHIYAKRRRQQLKVMQMMEKR